MFKNWYPLIVIRMTLLVFGFGLRWELVQHDKETAPNDNGPVANGNGTIVHVNRTVANGMVILSKGNVRASCSSAALDPVTGGIVVTGVAHTAEARSNFLAASVLSTGALNTTFGGGIVATSLGGCKSSLWDASRACAVQPDGRVLSAGWHEELADGASTHGFGLVRYNTNGTLDETFNEGGIVTTMFGSAAWLSAMALQSDGKIVLTGSSPGVDNEIITVRYTASGQLDTTFGSGGTVMTTVPNECVEAAAIVLQSSGRMVVAANLSSSAHMALIRYTAKGDVDTAFGKGGVATFNATGLQGSTMRDMVVDPADDSIIAAGESLVGDSEDLTLVRFTAGGLLDTKFGGGKGYIREDFGAPQNSSATSVALQVDGKIVICGDAPGGKSLVARFLKDGELDRADDKSPGFGPKGCGYADDFLLVPASGHAVLIQGDGKIVVAGTTAAKAIGIVRYNADGTPDTSL
jgi:uncharacterized delta-60 repeat protein